MPVTISSRPSSTDSASNCGPRPGPWCRATSPRGDVRSSPSSSPSSSCVSGDMETFVARAHELGVRHRERGALASTTRLVEQALTAALAAVLEDGWDEPTAQAWHRLYCLMSETMLEGSAGIALRPPAALTPRTAARPRAGRDRSRRASSRRAAGGCRPCASTRTAGRRCRDSTSPARQATRPRARDR